MPTKGKCWSKRCLSSPRAYHQLMRIWLLLFVFSIVPLNRSVQLGGRITEESSASPLPGARVTLFTPNLKVFREIRSEQDGAFMMPHVADGTYRLGVASLHYEYEEREVLVNGTNLFELFDLRAETNGGRWTIIGNTVPELLDGTGSGSLLSTGEILFCHDTEDPVVFDPVAGLKWFPPTSGSGQGCHIPTLNTDGALFLAGGSVDGYPQGLVVKTVKQYWRNTNFWSRLPDLRVARWYPGIVRLPNERLMILGGEQNGSPGRTAACEIFDPVTRTWTSAASFALPSEIVPAVLLHNGEVLKTWRYPELYNPASDLWRPAAPMLQERVGAAEGDHCDHEIIFLPDGRVMAVGIFPKTTNSNTRFTEFYSPEQDQWTLGPNPRYLRNRPEAVLLPDGRVLAFGGQYSGMQPAPSLRNAGTIPNCTSVADLYDPARNAWREMARMNRYIHYHNVTVLVPDGRVIATGGAGLTANNSFAGDDMSIEAFEPPYLFRGIRPEIRSLSSTDLRPGGSLSFNLEFTERPDAVILVSARAATHWVDGGPQRYLPLSFEMKNSSVTASIPDDEVKALAGYYMLFVLVDDIPSQGKIVRILPDFEVPSILPEVSLASSAPSAAESGEASGFEVARTGATTAPLRVDLKFGGSALNGEDFSLLPNYLVIPAGRSSVSVPVNPVEDNASERNEELLVSILDSPAYTTAAQSSAVIIIEDDEPAPPPPELAAQLTPAGNLQLIYTGPATRVVSFLHSTNLVDWSELARGFAETNQLRLVLEPDLSPQFFRAAIQ